MTVKCWQLNRILSELKLSENIISSILRSSAEYEHLVHGWFEPEYSIKVKTQDRAFLDYPLSDEIALKLLNEINVLLYSQILEEKLIVRAYRRQLDDKELTVTDAYKLIGGTGLEEVYEYGSFTVNRI